MTIGSICLVCLADPPLPGTPVAEIALLAPLGQWVLGAFRGQRSDPLYGLWQLLGRPWILRWTGGYCLIALVLAPYLRKFGQFTIPDFWANATVGIRPGLIVVGAAILRPMA